MKLKIQGKEYEFDLDEALQDLTGKETVMLEDYLGGFENLFSGERATRAVVVQVWLARKSAGENPTLESVEAIKGLMFGDAVELMEDPPLAEAVSESSPATSATDGSPGSPAETLATA